MRVVKPSLVVLFITVSLALVISLPTNSIISNLNKERDGHYDIQDIGNSSHVKHIKIQDRDHLKFIGGLKKASERLQSSENVISSLSNFNIGLISQFPGVYPDVVTYGNKVLVVYEGIGDYRNIVIQYSTDYGRNWSDGFFSKGPDELGYPFVKSNQTRPSIAIKPNGYAICVFESDDNSSRLYMLEFPDISSTDSWKISWINLSHLMGRFFYHIEGLKDLSISISDNNRVFISGVASITNVSSGITLHDAPIILYSNDGGETFTTIFSDDTPYRHLKKVSTSFDRGAYATYEMEDGGIVCLYFPDGDFYKDWEDFEIQDTDNTEYRNPSVYTRGDNVIIVLQSVSDGNSDIAYFYSRDSGDHWAPGVVEGASSSRDERFPSVSFMDGKWYILFEKNGNLYITNSTTIDSWGKIEKVNDVNGSIYPYFGFSRFGNTYGIVWSEIDGDHPVVRFSNMESKRYKLPDMMPDLSIIRSSVIFKSSGDRVVRNMKNMISFSISNNGNKTARDVVVMIFMGYKDRKIIQPISRKDIPSIKPGEIININMSLFYPSIRDVVKSLISFVDVGYIIIKVDPSNTIKEKREDNNNLSINVEYRTFFPRLYWLEKILIRMVGGEESGASDEVENLIAQVLNDDNNSYSSTLRDLMS